MGLVKDGSFHSAYTTFLFYDYIEEILDRYLKSGIVEENLQEIIDSGILSCIIDMKKTGDSPVTIQERPIFNFL